jgi:hypothetical protein
MLYKHGGPFSVLRPLFYGTGSTGENLVERPTGPTNETIVDRLVRTYRSPAADRALTPLYCRGRLVAKPNCQHQKTRDQQRAREQHGGRRETARAVLQIAT